MNKSSPSEVARYCPNADIPSHYGDAVLRVMVCNPHRLFVYWEITESLVNQTTALILHLSESECRETTNNEQEIEIMLSPQIDSHYVDVPFIGNRYTITLFGLQTDGMRNKLLSTEQTIPPLPLSGDGLEGCLPYPSNDAIDALVPEQFAGENPFDLSRDFLQKQGTAYRRQHCNTSSWPLAGSPML